MIKSYLAVFTIIIVLLAGCSSSQVKDISIETEANPKISFSGYKTYAWLGSAAIVNDSEGKWVPPSFDLGAEIKFLIDRELRDRGMSENSTDPDMTVVFALGVDMDSLGLKIDPETKMDALVNVPQGGLVIILVDKKSGFVIWTGVATADLHENPDTKLVKERLDYAVTKMLKKLPK